MDARQLNGFIVIDNDGREYKSWEHGIITKEVKIPNYAEIVEEQDVVLGQDGLYDHGTMFQNKLIEIHILVRGATLEDRINKINFIKKLLNPKDGFKKIVFTERPDVYYLAKISEAAPLQKLDRRTVEFTLMLNSKPYAYSLGTSVTFTGDSNNLEMSFPTKTDTEVGFRIEITGDLESSKPDDWWDLKDDSKNIIPNPRFIKNAAGNPVKWNVSQEYNDKRQFLEEWGYKETFPPYNDTKEQFINKIKDGTYVARKLGLKIDYEANESRYLVRKYRFYINGYELHTITEIIEETDWLGEYEYNPDKIREGINAVVDMLTPKIYVSSYLNSVRYAPYYIFMDLIDSFLFRDKDNDWFLHNTIEKEWDIMEDGKIEFNSIFLNVKEGKTEVKEITVKEWFFREEQNISLSSYYCYHDVFINGVFVLRTYHSSTKDFPYTVDLIRYTLKMSSGGTPYYRFPLLYDIGIGTSNTSFLTEHFAKTPYTKRMVNCPTEWEQSWRVENNVIQRKNPYIDPIGDIDENSLQLKVFYETTDWGVYYGFAIYLNGILMKHPLTILRYDFGFTSSSSREIIDYMQDAANVIGATITMDEDYINNFFDFLPHKSSQAQQVPDLYYTLVVNENGEIAEMIETQPITDNTRSWYDAEPRWILETNTNTIDITESKWKLEAKTKTNTIDISFVENTLLDIPHNKMVVTKRPFLSMYNRYKYVYSDIISIREADDYVLSFYSKGAGGKFGLLILGDDEQYRRHRLEAYESYEQFTRRYFTETLQADDKKVVVFWEFENTSRENGEIVTEAALPQLEIFPLTEFSENSTLYSIEEKIRKNLLDNSGFKFSSDGRMDRWGFIDNSNERILKNYTASDLPTDVNGKKLGYGTVELTCNDDSTNEYNAYMYQNVRNVKPSTTYTLSAYIKASDWSAFNGLLEIVERDADGSIIAAKRKDFNLIAAWNVYYLTITTTEYTASVDVRLITEKTDYYGTSGEQYVKFSAVQFEENSVVTKWEDDKWETEYQVVSKNLIYNPAFYRLEGETVPDGWSFYHNITLGSPNTTISTGTTYLLVVKGGL